MKIAINFYKFVEIAFDQFFLLLMVHMWKPGSLTPTLISLFPHSILFVAAKPSILRPLTKRQPINSTVSIIRYRSSD